MQSRISFPNLCELFLEIFQTYPRSSNRENYIVEQRSNPARHMTAEGDQLFFLSLIFSGCVVLLENMAFLEKKRGRSLSYIDFSLFSSFAYNYTNKQHIHTYNHFCSTSNGTLSFNAPAYTSSDRKHAPLKLLIIPSFQKLKIYEHKHVIPMWTIRHASIHFELDKTLTTNGKDAGTPQQLKNRLQWALNVGKTTNKLTKRT